MNPESPRKAGLNPMATGVVIVVIAGLAALGLPVVLKQRKAADRMEALNHLKEVATMLHTFECEYGHFPDDETALEVKEATKTDFRLTGQFSNDYFRQILAGGLGLQELSFWCVTAQTPKSNSVDDFSSAAKALEAGEVSFSYIMASPTRGQSSREEPSRAVVLAPSEQFRADWTFDPEPYSGKAVVLRLDCSVTPMPIREDNHKISTHPGKTLGDAGEGTPWGSGMTPVLRAPQPR